MVGAGPGTPLAGEPVGWGTPDRRLAESVYGAVCGCWGYGCCWGYGGWYCCIGAAGWCCGRPGPPAEGASAPLSLTLENHIGAPRVELMIATTNRTIVYAITGRACVSTCRRRSVGGKGIRTGDPCEEGEGLDGLCLAAGPVDDVVDKVARREQCARL